MKGDYETYWKKTGCEDLSSEFKDLILKFFAFEGKDRPTLKEIAEHPWMQVKCDVKEVQSNLLSTLIEKRGSD